ncbi:peptidase S8/S53 domain-containing protein [Roridomyces roridus]|uniref:tripeptidyl-peptidase II n=1 Tax=Roridomyces roridus TaxID=1738132 RepID=A0AAD7BKV6_9AGAR|nr:peptidase S8/S53 domain-containing protein [Roridomyces roridus]
MLWLSALVVIAQLSAAKPLLNQRWDDQSVKHAWVEIPKGWEYHSAPPADHLLDLRIGLKQDKIDQLISSLYEVSDPAHGRYGKHLSKEEVDALVAPHPDSVDAVEAWLEHHGINPSDAHFRLTAGEWVTIRVSVAQAERMLNTKYAVYRHPSTGSQVVRTMEYSLPTELHSHVDVISPTTYFGTMQSMRATSFIQPQAASPDSDSFATNISPLDVPASCGVTVTPACLRALYNTTDYVPQATDNNSLGIASYLEQYANDADLQTFFTTFRPDAVGSTVEHVQINGGLDDQSLPGIEANLDIQYSLGIAWPTRGTVYSTGGEPPFNASSTTPTNTNEPYLDWLNYLLNQTTIPQTLSNSYGDQEQTVPLDYATSVCNMFAQLGVRGSSLFTSSGDHGVGGGDCNTNDGTNTVKFQPIFPASCPYITAVGGTTGVNPEVAASLSGGGFSNYFRRPAYQTSTVASFIIALGDEYSDLHNASGRTYPDLAAQAAGFQVVNGGETITVGGTSASAPTVAGVFALLNDMRIVEGKSPLGFVNPLIYSVAKDGFNDIVSGNAPGCGTDGLSARAGWDAVTGLGTPDFLKLQALLKDARVTNDYS